MISIKKQSVDGLESWQTDLHDLTAHTKLERLGSGNTSQTVTNPDDVRLEFAPGEPDLLYCYYVDERYNNFLTGYFR